jgi:hypothetical protein
LTLYLESFVQDAVFKSSADEIVSLTVTSAFGILNDVAAQKLPARPAP